MIQSKSGKTLSPDGVTDFSCNSMPGPNVSQIFRFLRSIPRPGCPSFVRM